MPAMNPLRAITSWIGRLFRKGVGEKVFARLLGGFGPLGLPGSWSQHRREQVLHYRGWTYIAIRAICEAVAELSPQVAYVRQPQDVTEERRKSGRMLTKGLRRKAMTPLQHHEELEAVDATHPLLRLLRNPNEPDTSFTFWYRLLMYLELTGNTYVWAIPDGTGQPCELWILPSQWVWASPIREPDEIISEYEIRPYGTPGGAGVFRIPAEELIAIQYPHPLTLWDGFSPLAAGAAWTDISESIDAARWASFKNGIRPGLLVELDPQLSDPDDTQMDRLLARLRRYQGEQHADEPLILSPGAKVVQNYTKSAEEMGFHAGTEQMRDMVLALHRVSKVIAGITEEVNYASMIAAQAGFMRFTVAPKLKLIDGILTEKLAKRFDADLVIYHDDPAPVDPQQRNADLEVQARLKAVTPNEVRQEFGRDPFPNGGDSPIGTPSDVPLPYGEDAQDEAEALGEVLAQLQQGKGGGEEQGGAGQGQGQGNPLAALMGGPGDGSGGEEGGPANRLSEMNGVPSEGREP